MKLFEIDPWLILETETLNPSYYLTDQMLRKQAAGGLSELPPCSPSSTQSRLDSWLIDLEERHKQQRPPGGRRSITDLLMAPQDPHQMTKRRGSHSPRIQRAHSQQDPGTESFEFSITKRAFNFLPVLPNLKFNNYNISYWFSEMSYNKKPPTFV